MDINLLKTYPEMVAYWAGKNPDKPALIYDDKILTYKDFFSTVCGFERSLFQMGVREGNPVAVFAATGPDLICCIVAIAKMRALYVPLNPKFSLEEILNILRIGKINHLLLDPQFTPKDILSSISSSIESKGVFLSSYAYFQKSPQLAIDIKKAKCLNIDEPLDHRAIDIHEDFAIVFTSGTTGAAKGVVVNQLSGIATGYGLATCLDLSQKDVVFSLIPPISYINLCCSIPATLCIGATIVLPTYPLPIEKAVEMAKIHHVTFLQGVPTHYVRLIEYANEIGLHPLFNWDVKAMVSGSPCPSDVIFKVRSGLQITLCNHYGLAEFGGVSVVPINETDPDVIYNSVGYPFPWVEIKVAGKGSQGDDNSDGEILLKGPGMMRCYYGKQEETQKKIDASGWLHTEDAGLISNRQALSIVGRHSDMIIRGGNNIFPIEIEAILSECELVLDSVVVGLPDIELGEKIYLGLLLKVGYGIGDIEKIFAFLHEKLPKYKIPDYYFLLDTLPLNAAGKILRRDVKQMLISRNLAIYKVVNY